MNFQKFVSFLMAFWTSSRMCRFCGSRNDVIVNLVDTLLWEKLVAYFPIKFDPADSLPKSSCNECASTIRQMENFVLKAREVEKKLLEHASRPKSNVLSAAEIRSLANSVAAHKTKPQTQSVHDVLRKLTTTSSVVVKKITPQLDPLGGVGQSEDETSLMKMKMEVLDEEVVNLPAEDFIHYNDTDDDDPHTVYKHTFQVTSDTKGDNSTDESVSAPEDNNDEDYEPNSKNRTVFYQHRQFVGEEQQELKQTSKPRKSSTVKSIVINLTDPCHYVCVTCKDKFASFEDLQAHIDQSTACKRVSCTCEHCGKVCETRRALYQHKLSHNPKPQLVCDQCGKVYTNSFNLENHKSQVHGGEFEELGYVYKCCEQTFQTRRELNDHVATHSKKLNLLCDLCGKSFTSHKALRSHNQSHMNIRPFSCEVCGKSFRTKLLLVQHSHVHTGVKVFSCDLCEKSFAKKESLKRHYKLHSAEPVTWTSTGEKISVKPLDQLQKHQFVEFDSVQQDTHQVS
ncbi:gastrula zinc finger protein 5-1-like isoform X2 [Wyeomyia smithii]|uniref:gastrula zinc finger protein 5-1-like isoform X2 n=1 Tax=Wyeomyia smithii TaxID=174621 RepID=UPI002467D000|nr:gastrula zinc finger protein 5-1-like isoform X2 [Wyeomyia smithii]